MYVLNPMNISTCQNEASQVLSINIDKYLQGLIFTYTHIFDVIYKKQLSGDSVFFESTLVDSSRLHSET
jgi:hypothetical protein